MQWWKKRTYIVIPFNSDEEEIFRAKDWNAVGLPWRAHQITSHFCDSIVRMRNIRYSASSLLRGAIGEEKGMICVYFLVYSVHICAWVAYYLAWNQQNSSKVSKAENRCFRLDLFFYLNPQSMAQMRKIGLLSRSMLRTQNYTKLNHIDMVSVIFVSFGLIVHLKRHNIIVSPKHSHSHPAEVTTYVLVVSWSFENAVLGGPINKLSPKRGWLSSRVGRRQI